MPFPAATSTGMTLDGVTYNAKYTDTGNGFEGVSSDVGFAKPGTMTAAGVVTFAPGHGFVTGNLDLFWSGGMRRKESATLAGDVATLGGGGVGDPLPAVGVAVTAQPTDARILATTIDGAKIIAAGATSGGVGFCTWLATGGAGPDVTFKIRSPNDGPSWSKSSGAPSPFGAVVYDKVSFTSGDVGNVTFRAGVAIS